MAESNLMMDTVVAIFTGIKDGLLKYKNDNRSIKIDNSFICYTKKSSWEQLKVKVLPGFKIEWVDGKFKKMDFPRSLGVNSIMLAAKNLVGKKID